ncbi:MAG: acyl-CoA dehydrogenase family protein [Thermoplasmata archaeon]
MAAPVGPSTADWRQKARRFAATDLLPLAEAIDRGDRLPPGMPRTLGRHGFMGLGIPPEFGGAGASVQAMAAVLEEISWASPAVATMLSVHLAVAAAPILDWGSSAQKKAFLPLMATGECLGAFALTEPGAGSDAAHLACRYERTGDGFRLSGAKMFITNASVADVVILFATRDAAIGHEGISAFLLPKGTPGRSVGPHFDKLGLRGSETNEIVLQDARLGPDAMLGTEGQGLKIALGALTGGRVGIAACALGTARAAYDQMRAAVELDGAEWKRGLLARSFTQLSAASALVERAAIEKDAGRPFIETASAAKLAASQAGVEIASHAIDVIGPEAISLAHPAQRILRDARVFPIVEGTTEIQELILGRSLATSP